MTRLGGLGNQLFQYFSLQESGLSRGPIVMFGFSELRNLLNGTRIIDPIPSWLPKPWSRRLIHFLNSFFSFLVSKGLASSIMESDRNHKPYEIGKPKTLKIAISTQTFFSEDAVKQSLSEHSFGKTSIRYKWLNKAREFLDQLEPMRPKIFVQIRRGDYLVWPSIEKAAVLPMSWYFSAIDEVRNTLTNPLFIVVSDEPFFCEAAFKDFSDVVVSRNSEYVDFAIMSLADGGIASPSTFSWWASALNSNKSAIFYAPEYWAGHRSHDWFPEYSKTSFFSYLEVTH